MFVWLQTAFNGYFDVPEGMEYIVKYVNQRYKNTPVYVTENGEWQWTHEFTMHSVNSLTIEKLLVASHLLPYVYVHNDHVLSTYLTLSLSGYSQHSNNTMDELMNDGERVNYLQGYVTCLSSAVR